MGPSVNNEEPAMNTHDWRSELPSGSRQKIVNKILETLKRHLPYSGQEGINELKRIAVRFEEKIFSGAHNQTDYLRKISYKMLTMETKAQNAAGSSSNLGDWRIQFPFDSRQQIVNNIVDTLKKHLPYSGPEGINELRRLAARFEEKVFSCALQQTDYLLKISLKMMTMENKALNAAGSASSIPSDSNKLVLDELGSLMLGENSEPSPPKEEPPVNSGDWRIQLPPDSRQKHVDKLMETLKKHVPYSGQEGIEELRRIAISFEELIFNTALNQVDYFRKISLKMQTMEEDD